MIRPLPGHDVCPSTIGALPPTGGEQWGIRCATVRRSDAAEETGGRRGIGGLSSNFLLSGGGCREELVDKHVQGKNSTERPAGAP